MNIKIILQSECQQVALYRSNCISWFEVVPTSSVGVVIVEFAVKVVASNLQFLFSFRILII